MKKIGTMAMPVNFRYRDVFLKGKPQHDRWDPFLARHPRMDVRKRAKIFAPFDALRGFHEAVAAKDVIYRDKEVLSEEQAAELSRRLGILHALTCTGRMARANPVRITITYYETCSDVNHEAYGFRGQYKTLTGICRNVDVEETKTILIDETRVLLENVIWLESTESPEDPFQKRGSLD